MQKFHGKTVPVAPIRSPFVTIATRRTKSAERPNGNRSWIMTLVSKCTLAGKKRSLEPIVFRLGKCRLRRF